MSELVEGARLEIVYTATTVSGVRIPVSPPKENSRNVLFFAKKGVFGCKISRVV